MYISLAISDKEILKSYTVMHQLRTQYSSDSFLSKVKEQMEQGYFLALGEIDSTVVCAAGYRFLNNLAWKNFIYIDDLVTCQSKRSHGYGQMMINWLKNKALENNCSAIHLDSGTIRLDAHRFYKNNSFKNSSFHFSLQL